MPGSSGGRPSAGISENVANPTSAMAGALTARDGSTCLSTAIPETARRPKPDQVTIRNSTVKDARVTSMPPDDSVASWLLAISVAAVTDVASTLMPVSNISASTIKGWISHSCKMATTRAVAAPAITPLESRFLVIENLPYRQWQGKPVACRVSCVAA